LDGGRISLDIAIPANSHATVFVPTSNAQSVTEGGKPAAESPDIKFLRLEQDAAVFAVGSGTYHFQSTFH
jgi:alpha-L-rhamnosidase